MKNPLPSIQKFVQKYFMLILLTIFVIVVVLVLFNKQPPKPTPSAPKPTPSAPKPKPTPLTPPLKQPLNFKILNGMVFPRVIMYIDSSESSTLWKQSFTEPDFKEYPVSIPVGGSFNITYIDSSEPTTKSYNYDTMADVVKTNTDGILFITNDVDDNIIFNGNKAPY